MAEQFYTILTAIGEAKIANAAALGEKVELIELALGDGGGSYYNPTEDQTELQNEVWRGSINAVEVDTENPNWITIQTVVPSQHGGFMIREAGVFDNEGDLIAVGKYPETYKPVAADGSIKDLVVRMILEVGNTSSVQLKVDPTIVLATKKDINDLAGAGRTTQTVKGNADSIAALQQAFASHLADNEQQFLDVNLNIIDMAVELETLKGATLNGVTANIFIETFQNLNDINLTHGIYESENKRLVL